MGLWLVLVFEYSFFRVAEPSLAADFVTQAAIASVGLWVVIDLVVETLAKRDRASGRT